MLFMMMEIVLIILIIRIMISNFVMTSSCRLPGKILTHFIIESCWSRLPCLKNIWCLSFPFKIEWSSYRVMACKEEPVRAGQLCSSSSRSWRFGIEMIIMLLQGWHIWQLRTIFAGCQDNKGYLWSKEVIQSSIRYCRVPNSRSTHLKICFHFLAKNNSNGNITDDKTYLGEVRKYF